MSTGLFVVVAIAVFLTGFAIAWWLFTRRRREVERAASGQADALVANARAEAETIRRDAQIESKEVVFRAKQEAEHEAKAHRDELAKHEEALAQREINVEKKAALGTQKEETLQKKEKSLAGREQAAEAAARQAQQLVDEARLRLEKAAGMTAADAQKKLQEQVIDEAKKAAAVEIKRVEEEARVEAEERGKKILAMAIQRYASEYVAERTVSVVSLPNDEMKGRIIGREGRNIRALEAATGIDLIIDDTPEAVIISCFNPVRREIARLALSRLIADGRIHPTRIEEVVAKCTEEVEQQCKEAGEQAVFDLGLHRVHPELVKLLGRLKFRSSYAQNLLQHSIEVGFMAGIMAGELGLNVKQARRAGLLHDIGKAVDQETEGPHGQIGANLARKHGESPRVAHAIEAHHGEVAQETVLDHLVDAANRISGQRPGARREQMESYVQRLHDMEKIASRHQGVSRAFAIQAGREVRVLVENSAVSDEQALMLSRDIARTIEDELSYPGQIRIAVLRETRAIDYAK
jgi:ribonuclease Y